MATDYLGPLVREFLIAVEPHLTNSVGRVVLIPGNSVVVDDCCEGQLHMRIVSIVGSSALSNSSMQPCLPMYQVRCAVGVNRCAHTIDDQGVAPTPSQMSGDAMLTFQDRADLVEALVCSIYPIIEERNDCQSLRIEDWTPTTVQGGCVGGEITFTFSHILCTPCEENLP